MQLLYINVNRIEVFVGWENESTLCCERGSVGEYTLRLLRLLLQVSWR